MLQSGTRLKSYQFVCISQGCIMKDFRYWDYIQSLIFLVCTNSPCYKGDFCTFFVKSYMHLKCFHNLTSVIYLINLELDNLLFYFVHTTLDIYVFISSPDPKGHVRYCHHLASVVHPSSVR